MILIPCILVYIKFACEINVYNFSRYLTCIKVKNAALAGVAQWFECWTLKERVASSIPSQSTSLGCSPGPQQGEHDRQPHIDVSLPLSLPSPLSKNK